MNQETDDRAYTVCDIEGRIQAYTMYRAYTMCDIEESTIAKLDIFKNSVIVLDDIGDKFDEKNVTF